MLQLVSQTLRSEIEARALPLGSTPTGRDWCIKALHPSDPMTEVRGIPDLSAVPSLLMNYQATLTFGPAAGATGTWSFNSTLLPHPVNFFAYEVYDSVNTAGLVHEFDNPQLSGTTHQAKYNSFSALAQRWRLAYCSVTIHQDGPSLANQGSIVVSQPVVSPYRYYPTVPNKTLGIMVCPGVAESYSNEDYPSFQTSQSMPNAYFARSKDGVYVPLKLTETCQDWVSDAHAIAHDRTRFGGTSNNCLLTSNTGVPPAYPHWDEYTLSCVVNDDGNCSYLRTSPMLNATVAHICAENLSVDTRFTCFFRYGIEMQVSPTSTLAPQQKLSPEYDAVALEAYFRIARELKDAFPADYNDLGKIWDNIAAAAQQVLPLLKKAGPYGNALATGGKAVILAGNAIRASRQKRKGKGKPSQPAKSSGDRGNPPAAARERATQAQLVRDAIASGAIKVVRSKRGSAEAPN